MTAQDTKTHDASIIALDRFIQATRDSGYKGTASAISELIDNSIQAGATRIAISLTSLEDDDELVGGIEIAVLDNGCGMDPFTLRQALRFGGSSRFGDRSGLGRYGMGLPNASLSQARRVDVYTWQPTGNPRAGRGRFRSEPATRVYRSYLDVDEIVRCEMVEVPRPALVKDPPDACVGPSGTLVTWTRCDRLENRRVSTITKKLEAELSRRFRHYLWKKLRITINGHRLRPFDPLYLHTDAVVSGAREFGEEVEYEIRADASDPKSTGWVRVRFSELPVHEWHKLSNDEKRRTGVSKGAGVSIVRAGREVDYGWFFMGSKHRENYDDWWRCEVQFEPKLDEAFGIAHTKQQVRPQAHLIEALTPDLEMTARVLNGRARKAHVAIKAGERFSEAERVANERDHLLPRLPSKAKARGAALMKDLQRAHVALRGGTASGSKYAIVEDTVKDTSFFNFAHDGDRLVLVLNPSHPFYREIYRPLADGDTPRDQQLRAKLELLLLAAARTEAGAKTGHEQLLARNRLEWSNTLAAFFND